MARDAVEIWLLLRDARKFIEQASQAGKAVTGIGDSAEKSGKKAALGWKGIAKWAGGAAAIYGTTRYIKGAVSSTEDLAKSTLQLQRVTGMDTRTSSEWVGVLKQRHVSSEQFGRSIAVLSKQIEKARLGSVDQSKTMRELRKEYAATAAVGGKKAPAALAALQRKMDSATKRGAAARKTFASLGVSMDAISRGDTQEVIAQVADRFKVMTNPAKRAAAAQTLFGRSAQRLAPILFGGREAIEENLKMQERYGNVLSGKSVADTRALIHEQHEMEAAMNGVKVTVGTALIPIIVQVGKVIVQLTSILQPFIRSSLFLKIALVALVVAFIAYKVALIAAGIAQLFLTSATLGWIAVAGLILLALVAIGVGLYVLYKKWAWFHNAVDAVWHSMQLGAQKTWAVLRQVWSWIKANWPLLLGILGGPFALAAVLIIRHFRQIKATVVGVIDAIKAAIRDLFAFVRNLPTRVGRGVLGKIGGAARHVPGVSRLFGGQHGGVVPRRSNVLVGERGPEILTLPKAATVTPLPVPQGFDVSGAFGTADITVPVYLDRRVLAQAVAQYSADRLARR